jgi:hypothetical protein
MTMSNKANAALAAHDYQQATAALAEELAAQREHEHEHQHGLAGCLLAIAELASETGHLGRAATLLGAVAKLREANPASVEEQISYDRIAANVRAQLGMTNFTRARQQGHTMSRAQAIDYALITS